MMPNAAADADIVLTPYERPDEREIWRVFAMTRALAQTCAITAAAMRKIAAR